MTRPQRCRLVAATPGAWLFKPAGVPARSLGEVSLTVDEFEALRLADYEGLYQEQAAEEMAVSRQTFGRIVEKARNKVARALVDGLVLRIEGGVIEMADKRVFECADCGHVWEVPFGAGRPAECPSCQGKTFHRAVEAAVGNSAGGPPAGRGGRCHRHRNGPGAQGRGQCGQRRRAGRAVAAAKNEESEQ